MRYVALFRGINVGGHNKIKMDELREMFGSLGFENVKSYIASGNVAFDTKKTKVSVLTDKIERAVKENFSLEIEVMLRTVVEIKAAIERNPFEKEHDDDHTKLFVVFLKDKLTKDKADLLESNNNENEKFAVTGREVFALSKKGFMGSLLGKKYIDNKLKTPATARNWRTVNKIAGL